MDSTDNEMDDVAREYVAELLKITAEANDECRKLCGTDFKPPIHLYSITFTMKEVNKLEVCVVLYQKLRYDLAIASNLHGRWDAPRDSTHERL